MYIWTFSVVALKYVVYIPWKLRHGSASLINVEKYILGAKYDHLLMNFVGFSTSKPPERLNKVILSGSGRKGCWCQELLKVSLEMCPEAWKRWDSQEDIPRIFYLNKWCIVAGKVDEVWVMLCPQQIKHRPNLKKKEKKTHRKC